MSFFNRFGGSFSSAKDLDQRVIKYVLTILISFSKLILILAESILSKIEYSINNIITNNLLAREHITKAKILLKFPEGEKKAPKVVCYRLQHIWPIGALVT